MEHGVPGWLLVEEVTDMNTLFDMASDPPPEPKPRRAPRVMMKVIDAGDQGDVEIVQMKCKKCGHETGWIPASKPWSKDKWEGRPCPVCNKAVTP